MTSDTLQYSDLIPDYCHGILLPEKKTLFEKELGQNSELRQELEEFKRFQELYCQIDSELPEPSVEMFAKINASIDNEESRRLESSNVFSSTSFLTKFQKVWDWFKESVTVPWGLAVLQAAVIVILLMPAPPREDFKTLSSSPAIQNIKDGIALNIIFKPITPEATIRELLLSAKATITSGPSAQGRYTIELSHDTTEEKAIHTLRQSPFIIFLEKTI